MSRCAESVVAPVGSSNLMGQGFVIARATIPTAATAATQMSDLEKRLQESADEWCEMCGDIHIPLLEAAEILAAVREWAEQHERQFPHQCGAEVLRRLDKSGTR